MFEIVSRSAPMIPRDWHAFQIGTHVEGYLQFDKWTDMTLHGTGGERDPRSTCLPGDQRLLENHVRPLTRAARQMLALVKT